MIITGIKKSNENITLFTKSNTISFDLYPTDTPQKLISELSEEGFKILNIDYLKKLLNMVLYTRFISII